MTRSLILELAVLILAAAVFPSLHAQAGGIREPVFAGKFYPADPHVLKRQIRQFTEETAETEIKVPEEKSLKALILPHAGYKFSGRTAAHASRVLKDASFSKVIVIGPDHRLGFKNAAVSTASAYKTPLGKVRIHEDAAELRHKPGVFRSVPESERTEHSVEVILPFLQTYMKDFSLVPVVMGSGSIKRYAEGIDSIYGKNTLLVVSSDLSHYLSYDKARKRDRSTIDMILNLDAESLASGRNRACGETPIRVLINLARRHKWEPVLLYYENSGDTAGPRRKVVGYAAIAFYGEEPMKESSRMSEEKGRLLVELARQTLEERLRGETEGLKGVEKLLDEEIFQTRRGTFVTLTKNSQLRGCIGNLVPEKTIVQGVKENAVNAAFNDPRFPALSKEELDKISIEVSLLTEPQPLEYKDADDLLSKLRPNVDGVIIRRGMHSATFLPQVWEQLGDKEMFLSHLCMKAGLPENEWRKGNLEVLTYQVQYFEEQE